MDIKKHHFFAFISRMKYINRWGLMRNTQSENIQEHSLQVAMIAHALAIIKNEIFEEYIDAQRVAVLGMFHDCNETITGDLPTPINYFNIDIVKAYKKVEEISKNKLISMLPEKLKSSYSELLFNNKKEDENWKLVKAADKISAYIKCKEEEKAGNNEFKKANETIFKAIKDMNIKEVNYFMDNFIPSFSLTIDELE